MLGSSRILHTRRGSLEEKQKLILRKLQVSCGSRVFYLLNQPYLSLFFFFSFFLLTCCQGKPGFGKTTLSVSIIEDLRSNGDGDGEGDTTAHDTEAVVYFYFDLQRPDKRRFSDVLRATITQLIHRYQEDCVVIDAISLLMDLKGSGQLKASPRELAEMFLLFLSRLSLVTLVLDGINECENFAESLPFLTEASLKRNFRSLFLGRPSVQIPEKTQRSILPGFIVTHFRIRTTATFGIICFSKLLSSKNLAMLTKD